MLSIPALSTEYIRVQVSAVKSGVAADPTADGVQFSFPSEGTDPVTWYVGSWETVTSALGVSTYYARCLVGPSGGVVNLVTGKYDIWVKVTDSPEIPVLNAGTLVVT